MDVIDLPLGQIIPYARNPRRNEKAVATVAASIAEFGRRQLIVVDEAMVVLAGHTRLAAAQQLGLKSAPVHVAKGLTEAQARAFRIMDNRSGENAEWDNDLLGLELGDLLEADFDLDLTSLNDEELSGFACRAMDDTPVKMQTGAKTRPDSRMRRSGRAKPATRGGAGIAAAGYQSRRCAPLGQSHASVTMSQRQWPLVSHDACALIRAAHGQQARSLSLRRSALSGLEFQ